MKQCVQFITSNDHIFCEKQISVETVINCLDVTLFIERCISFKPFLCVSEQNRQQKNGREMSCILKANKTAYLIHVFHFSSDTKTRHFIADYAG